MQNQKRVWMYSVHRGGVPEQYDIALRRKINKSGENFK